MPSPIAVCGGNIAVRSDPCPVGQRATRTADRRNGMTKPIPPLDLSWLLIESPAGPTHGGAMLLFKKPPGRTPIVREIVKAYRACPPVPPFNYVPELLGR